MLAAVGLTGGAAFGGADSAAGYPSALRASAAIAAADLYLFSSPGRMGRLIAQVGLAAPPGAGGRQGCHDGPVNPCPGPLAVTLHPPA